MKLEDIGFYTLSDSRCFSASFSAKIYGKRSHQNRKKKETEAPKEPEV